MKVMLTLRQLLLLLLLAAVGELSAEEKSGSGTVDTQLDSVRMVVGEQTCLRLSVNIQSGQKVMFPQWKPQENIVPGLEVVENPRLDTILQSDGTLTVTQNITLTAFEDSVYLIPAQTVRVDGREYASRQVALKVYTVDVDTTKLEQFYGPKSIQANPFLWSEWRGVLLISALTMVLYGVMVVLWMRLKSKKPLVLRVRKIKHVPPHQRALNAIDEIKKDGGAVEEKEYYTRLTEALRRYIEERYGFNAMEMTSAEIIDRLKATDDTEKLTELTELFLTADLVKFAKYSVGMSENDRNLLSAIDFINTNKREITLPPEEEVAQESEKDRQDRNIRRLMRWGLCGVTLAAVALLCYSLWLIYDLIM